MGKQIDLPLANWLGGRNAMARAAQINILWIGYKPARQVLPLPALAGGDLDHARYWLTDAVQRIVDVED
jgi:hypothetical protein